MRQALATSSGVGNSFRWVLNDLNQGAPEKSKKVPYNVDSIFVPPKPKWKWEEKCGRIWLRDLCTCPQCVDPSTKQKLFQTSDIPRNIKVSSQEILDDGSLKVTWDNDVAGFADTHVSVYPRDIAPKQAGPSPFTSPFLWDKTSIESRVKFIDYDTYMTKESGLWEALEHLRLYGLVFIRGVPATGTAVEDLGSRIGPLRHSFYGRTWDVKSVPQAKNIAYTHQYLGLHMDLLYMDNPPYLQLLHCIKNSCTGGSSMFSDAYAAASQIKDENPAAYQSLCTFEVPYHYNNAGESYFRRRRIVEVKNQEIQSVAWSPPFQAPYPVQYGLTTTGAKRFRTHHMAAQAFAAKIESPESIYEYRLAEGECVIFNNRRVLHARRAFDVTSGERWLKGAYLDRDAYKSRWTVLQRSQGCKS